jgi:hypothetical protein
MTPSHPSKPLVTTTIDFESLAAPGNGTGGLEVRNQFAASGIIFQPVTALDYSLGIPILNFAHSGTKAVELCHAIEFCTGKLDVSFTAPQRRVKVWTGYSFRLDSAQVVILRAFDGSGNQVASNTKVLGPSSNVIPISTPLEVTVPSATIVRVTAGFLGAEPPNVVMFNNALAFDDLEFDAQGPAPTCPATQPPTFTVSEPTNGKLVIQNAFSLDANLTTPDPFATLQINATGSGGTRTFGPFFAASGHIQIFNISSMLFPGSNTLVFIAKDCAGTRQVTRTVIFRNDVRRTAIHVINESGANVQTARVYANGNFLGLTDAVGMLFVSPALNSGTSLVARKLVAESSTYRDNHSQGSSQDWKFRVYTSSMAVNNDGTLATNSVNLEPDPLAEQVLRVMRRNALIGVHVVASLEWDASVAEMEAVKQKLLSTSRFLYNATDGQIFIEQAEVVDDAKFWEDADYRVYANQSLRAYVDSPRGGFFDDSFWTNGSWIHVQINNDGPTYAHEFGHYGFDVGDEYKDNRPDVHCTAQLTLGTIPPGLNPFQAGLPRASCMMWNQWSAPKLCSSRPGNPHVGGTRQGGSSCWSTLSGHYRDSNSTARWLVQTPDSRGAIPGTINGGNLPLNDMPPRVNFDNTVRPNLCAPIGFQARHSDGTPQKDREIWLETTYGADILEGKTNDLGQLTATGLHVGDEVEGLTIQPVNCTPIARISPTQRSAPRDSAFADVTSIPVSFQQRSDQPATQQIELPPAPFSINTVVKPTLEGAEVTVSFEGGARGEAISLTKTPVVRFKLKGDRDRAALLRYDAKSRGYVATIAKLPIDAEVEIEVTATNPKGQSVKSVGRFQIGRPDPGYETDLLSSDGQISLTIPAKGLPAGARVSIGPTAGAVRNLPEGFSLVAGPFAIWSYPVADLYQPGTLRFQLPHERKGSSLAEYEEGSVRVLRFDGQKWEDLGGTVLPHPIDVISVETRKLGLFALVGKRGGKPYQQSAFSTVAWPTRLSRFGNLLTY